MSSGVEALFWISVATVSKVLLIAITGILLATQMTGGRESVKGLGFYTVYVLLPCLLFTKLADNLSWELVQSSFVCPLFGCLAITIGHVCGQFFKRYVPKPLQGHVVLACTCQNAVSFALALLYSLKGLSWLNSETLDIAQSYVFLYNIPISFSIWGIGSTIVRKSAKELEELQENPLGNVSRRGGDGGSGRVVAEDLDKNKNTPSTTKAKNQKTGGAEENGDEGGGVKNFLLKQLLPALKNPPMIASACAIVIALTPPLEFLVHVQPLHTLMAGLRLVGDGCVPLQLLVLGCNLVGSSPQKKNTAAAPVVSTYVAGGAASEKSAGGPSSSSTTAMDRSESSSGANHHHHLSTENLEALSSGSAVSKRREEEDQDQYQRLRLEAQEKLEAELASFPPKKLGLFVGFVRLVVVPSILFICLHLFYTFGFLGESKIFMLVMFIEICAPSAINASILVNLYNYRPREYTEMLLTVYTMSIVTTTFWMSVALYYINNMM